MAGTIAIPVSAWLALAYFIYNIISHVLFHECSFLLNRTIGSPVPASCTFPLLSLGKAPVCLMTTSLLTISWVLKVYLQHCHLNLGNPPQPSLELSQGFVLSSVTTTCDLLTAWSSECIS